MRKVNLLSQIGPYLLVIVDFSVSLISLIDRVKTLAKFFPACETSIRLLDYIVGAQGIRHGNFQVSDPKVGA